MEESISGFKRRGDWGDVVEHGERVTVALREAAAADAYPTAFAAWDEWRPKAHETIDADVNEKTAEQASVGEGEGEKAGKEPEDDLQTAGERLTESYERLGSDDAEGAVEHWRDSIEYVARAADTVGRKALRAVEGVVYKNVMTAVAPYYFDNELVSANIQHVRSQDEFELEVNVNNSELRAEVRDHLRSFENIQRWHVDTERDVENAALVEGVEPPAHDTDTKPTTN